MSIELPITEPTDEPTPRRRIPGQSTVAATMRKIAKNPGPKDYDMGVVAAVSAPPGAPRSMADIPTDFRHPTKPPGRRP